MSRERQPEFDIEKVDGGHLLATFRSDYEHEIEYEYNFWISNQSRFQRLYFSFCLPVEEEAPEMRLVCDARELKTRSRTQI